MEDYIKIDNEITGIFKSIKWLKDIDEKSSFLQFICEDLTNEHKTFIKDHKGIYESVIGMNRLLYGN